MKFKTLLVVLVAGLVCLPSMSYGQDDIAALRQKAEQGDTEAQRQLGLAYYNGKGVPQDYKEAVRWYRLAAEQGYAKAQRQLGYAYAKGKGIPQDYKEAVKWYRLAADQGNVSAQFDLGNAYDEGRGVPQDSNEAVRWYRLAAEQGYGKAKSVLDTKAEKLPPSTSAKSSSSEQGNAKAQLNASGKSTPAPLSPPDKKESRINDLLAASPAAVAPLPPPDEEELRLDALQANLHDLDGKVIRTSFNRCYDIEQMDNGMYSVHCLQYGNNGFASSQNVFLPEAGKEFFQAMVKRGYNASPKKVYFRIHSKSPIRVRRGESSSRSFTLEAVGTHYDTSKNQYSW